MARQPALEAGELPVAFMDQRKTSAGKESVHIGRENRAITWNPAGNLQQGEIALHHKQDPTKSKVEKTVIENL
jgi:hypothetical protein